MSFAGKAILGCMEDLEDAQEANGQTTASFAGKAVLGRMEDLEDAQEAQEARRPGGQVPEKRGEGGQV